MSTLTVREGPDGWSVVDAAGAVRHVAEDNAAAWRWLDDHDDEAGDHEDRRRRISVAMGER